ncbi:hypothetical protein BC835DRAFT_176893 [Cytidiella melzeri]|nr:hypothetical protein BC835DRAFT_176893 [Cytidiella melzeri]
MRLPTSLMMFSVIVIRIITSTFCIATVSAIPYGSRESLHPTSSHLVRQSTDNFPGSHGFDHQMELTKRVGFQLGDWRTWPGVGLPDIREATGILNGLPGQEWIKLYDETKLRMKEYKIPALDAGREDRAMWKWIEHHENNAYKNMPTPT